VINKTVAATKSNADVLRIVIHLLLWKLCRIQIRATGMSSVDTMENPRCIQDMPNYGYQVSYSYKSCTYKGERRDSACRRSGKLLQSSIPLERHQSSTYQARGVELSPLSPLGRIILSFCLHIATTHPAIVTIMRGSVTCTYKAPSRTAILQSSDSGGTSGAPLGHPWIFSSAAET
jgi:hypothetical protein